MKIAIDARVLKKGITGIGRYLEDILNGLPLIDPENKYYLFSYTPLNRAPSFYSNISTGNPCLPDKIFSPFWLNFILPKYLKRFNIDVFFTPNHLLPLRKISTKTVIAVHDIAYQANVKFHPFSYRLYMNILLPPSLKKSDKIIAISAFTRDFLVDIYNVDISKIKIIYRSADKRFIKKDVTDDEKKILATKFNLPKIFVLYVGMIENRKNILGILKISDIIKRENFPIEFVLIGKPGHGFNKIHPEMLKRDNVHYVNNVNDDELVNLYNLAFVFLFPSYFEGFGLPPLEAMQTGLPVLVSNRASLPEVVGDAGIVKEPDDYLGFANEIIRMYKDPNYYGKLKNKVLDRSSCFNYLDSIKAFVKILNDFGKG